MGVCVPRPSVLGPYLGPRPSAPRRSAPKILQEQIHEYPVDTGRNQLSSINQ